MTVELDAASRAKLKGVHPDLVKIVQRAAELSNVPFRVIEGMRSVARQRELVRIGASKTMNSRHLTGHAVDIVPLVNGKVSWDWPLYHKLAPFIKRAAKELKIPLEWGGDWRTFKDGPHWQLPFAAYPKTKSLGIMIDTAEEYTNESETAARMKDVGAIGVGGAGGSALAIGEAADSILWQQGELTSGDWIRVGIAAVIVGISLYAIWRRMKA